MNLYEILQNPDRVGEGMTHFERLFAQKVGGGKINEISGIPPLNYIGKGYDLTDYLISGNAVQDGTPTPDAPVDVVGCGIWDETQQSYKLPLTVNGTEYPIYLGQVESTRRVKKLVLTGEETIAAYDPAYSRFSISIQNSLVVGVRLSPAFCSHYLVISDGRYITNVPNNSIYSDSGNGRWFIKTTDFTTVADFKSYLAAQYAAGTPVTVWYVLAEPETAIVNEPLMKIGDYADTVSFAQAGVTIPTVNGENVLDVPTEVKPSDVWIRGRIKEV